MVHEQVRILVERPVVRVGIDDELRVRQRLLHDEGVHGRDDDVVAALHDQHRLTDILQLAMNALGLPGIFADGLALRGAGFRAHLGIAILAAPFALQERHSRGPAGGRWREMYTGGQPAVLDANEN